ncbi:MAG TPA: hypothetical protein VFI37_13400 [Gaiellaceae bacterium]|nr:hypothetical protein [Gaiellaceae bacterium]
MAADILEHTSTLAVFPGRQPLDDARSSLTSTGERRIDIRDAHLDQVGHATAVRSDAIRADVRDDDRTIETNPHLRTMRIADPQRVTSATCGARLAVMGPALR